MVKNKARVEGSIANVYLVREVSYFCSHYFEEHVYNRARNVPRNDPQLRPSGEELSEDNFTIFKTPRRLQGKMRTRRLTLDEQKVAHYYVIFNSPQIDPYITRVKKKSVDPAELEALQEGWNAPKFQDTSKRKKKNRGKGRDCSWDLH